MSEPELWTRCSDCGGCRGGCRRCDWEGFVQVPPRIVWRIRVELSRWIEAVSIPSVAAVREEAKRLLRAALGEEKP